jgi:hypothetical protein
LAKKNSTRSQQEQELVEEEKKQYSLEEGQQPNIANSNVSVNNGHLPNEINEEQDADLNLQGVNMLTPKLIAEDIDASQLSFDFVAM